MIKGSTALKARIQNKTGGDSSKSQIMLRIYMMERFLERLSKSGFKNNFVLKGGLLISSLLGVDMRSTMDIDATVKSLPFNEESAKAILEEIMAIPLEDGIGFKITKCRDIMEGREYEGLRFTVECTLDNLKQTIKIDISVGDEITPRAIAYKFPLVVEDRSIDLWAYNLETLLAEKLETIIVRADATTRMRDFYDIYILLQYERSNIDEAVLKNAFYATCRRRHSETMISQMDKIIKVIDESEIMPDQWEKYRKHNYYVGNLEWSVVMASVKDINNMIKSAGK